ncbi:PAS domain S-box protein [Elusimicrobiota bacterium]
MNNKSSKSGSKKKKVPKDNSVTILEKALKKAKKEANKINAINQQLKATEQQLRAANQQLCESEERLSAFMESATENFGIYDSKLNLIDINKAGLSMWPAGTKKNDLIGKNFCELAPNLKKTGRYDKYMKVIKTGNPFYSNDIIPHGKFGDIHLEVRAFKVGDGFGMITNDITKRKKVEEERERILNLSYDLICIAGMDGYFKYVNPSWEKILGYTKGELLSRPFLDFIHPDDHRINDAEVEKLGKGAQTIGFENRYIHKDGSVRTISWTATPLAKEKQMYCIGRDITEKREAEEKIKAANQQLQAGEQQQRALNQQLRASNQQLAASEKKTVKANNNMRERMKELNCLHDISVITENPEELLDRMLTRVVKLLPPSWQYPGIACARITVEGKKYETKNFRKTKYVQSADIKVGNKKTGKIEVVYLKKKPELDEGPFMKEERRLINSIAERLGKIIESKKVDEELQESEYRYRNLTESLNELVYRANPKTFETTYANRAIEKIYGYTAEDWIKNPGLWENNIYPEDKKRALKEFEEVARKMENAVVKYRIIRKDGAIRWVEDHVSWERDKDGKAASMNGIVSDFTERKKVEEQLQAFNQKLQANDQQLRASNQQLRATNQQLYAAEEGLRLKNLVFDEAIASLSIADVSGIITQGNPEFLKMWGYDKMEDAVGKSVASFFVDEKDTGPVIEALNSSGRWEGEFCAKRADGSEFISRGMATVLKNSRGDIIGYQSANLDVTARKKAEDQIRQSEKTLQTILASMSFGVVIIGKDKTIRRVNKAALSLMGYKSKEEIIGKVCHQSLCPAEENKCPILDLKKNVDRSEKILVTRNGKHISILKSVIPVTIDKEDVLLETFVDISERKKAEEELQEKEYRYRTLVENVPQKIFLKDKKSTYVSCNENYATDLKIKPDEIVGKTDYDFYPRELAEKYRKDDRKLMASGKTEDIEEEYIVNGQKEFVHTVKTPIVDDEGNVNGVLGVFWDVSKQRKAEKEKIELQQQLAQSQKMESIGTLAGGIAHDFNNILTAIQGDTDLLLEENTIEDQFKDDLRNIKGSVKRAADLVKQLLIFSRKQPVNMITLEVNETINNMYKMIFRLLGEDVAVKSDLCNEKCYIKADLGNIEQILINLVVNSRDAMPGGGSILIETRKIIVNIEDKIQFGDVSSGEYIHLSVEDTGSGMSEELQEKIFEPFFTTKGEGKGTGLGLSVVFGIVKAHNAGINVYSELGKGTIFSMYFPVVKSEESKENGTKNISTSYMGNGEKILVIEDESDIQMVAERMLEKNNYKVSLAKDVKTAVEMYEKGEYDLVFTDMILPDGTGLELIEKINKIKPIDNLLITSGYLDDKSRWEEITKKEIPFIHKPYGLEELRKKIEEILK